MRLRLLAALSSLGLIAASPAAPPDLTWIEGSWIQCGSKTVVEERWILAAAPAELAAVSVTRRAQGGKFLYEFLRIGKNGEGWAYFADPSGQKPAVFPLVESAPGRAVFEDPQHDFPTRIVYWREGETLNATIEGPGGKGRQRWTYRRNDGRGCA